MVNVLCSATFIVYPGQDWLLQKMVAEDNPAYLGYPHSLIYAVEAVHAQYVYTVSAAKAYYNTAQRHSHYC